MVHPRPLTLQGESVAEPETPPQIILIMWIWYKRGPWQLVEAVRLKRNPGQRHPRYVHKCRDSIPYVNHFILSKYCQHPVTWQIWLQLYLLNEIMWTRCVSFFLFLIYKQYCSRCGHIKETLGQGGQGCIKVFQFVHTQHVIFRVTGTFWGKTTGHQTCISFTDTSVSWSDIVWL